LTRRVVTKPWNNEVLELFRQHLRFLRAGREDTLAQIATSQETIERSRAPIVQIDEQIGRIERELRLVGGEEPRSEHAATAQGISGDHE
jgi:hypothetical protein